MATSATQDLIEAILHRGAVLDDIDAALIGKVERLLRRAEREIVERLRDVDVAGSFSRTQRQVRLERILRQIHQTLGVYEEATAAAHSALATGAGDELAAAEKALLRVLKPAAALVEINTVAVGPDLLATLAEETRFTMGDSAGMGPVSEWFDSQRARVRGAFTEQLQRGILNGESIDVLVARVAGGRGFDGIMPIARGWAESLVRTSVTAVMNAARMRSYEANTDTIKGVVQVSTRDERTTLVCIAYHHQRWFFGANGALEAATPGGLPYNGGIPRHPRCRSFETPWVKSWQEMGIARKDVSPELRRLLDGEGPAGDGEDLLAALDEAAQQRILGAGRWQLWRSRKVRLRDMLDSRGQVRPLVGLR